jgi:transcription initiation factor TFIIIB Brf1 subunit/transcription initiation factor TFIIB
MFGSNNAYPPRNDCFHSSVTEDIHEGTVICLDCALVLEDQLFLAQNEQNEPMYEQKKVQPERDELKKRKKEKEELTLEELTLLNELEASWHLTKKGTYTILKIYNKSTKVKSKFSTKELLAYATYSYLMENEYNLNADDIVFRFDLKNKNILFQIAAIVNDKTIPKVNTFLQYNSSIMNFSFKEKQFLSQLVQQPQFTNLSHHLNPKSLGVLIIIWYCSMYYPHYTKKDICMKCEISYANIRKLLKQECKLKEFMLHIFQKNKDTYITSKGEHNTYSNGDC